MNVFELFGTIAINNSDANRKIDQTGKLAQNLTSIFKKVGTAVATVFAVDKIKDFGNACAQTYATIAAENSAFAQIMGDYSDVAKEKMQKVADETGVVASRLTPYMTSMTAKFKGLGYGVDEATTLATEGLTIASDAAAFWDKSLDESMSHLNSFINGSYEGGEAIGLFANDTQMASYAVRQKIVKETKEWSKLDEAKKQALRMQYAKEMYKQSGATGQAAKESGEYANVLANLKEHWRQLQGIIGKPIMQKVVLPALQKLNALMPKINEKVQGITEKVTEGFESVASYFKNTFADVFTENGINLSGVPKAFSKMFGDLSQKAKGWLTKFGGKLSTAWTNSVWPSVQEFMKVQFGIEVPDWGIVASKLSTWWNDTALPFAKTLFTHPLEIVMPAWDTFSAKVNDWLEEESVYTRLKELLKWTLGNFEAPDTSFITDVETWWTGTGKPAVTEVVQWTFGKVVLPSWVDFMKDVTDWWNDDIKPLVADLTEWLVDPKFPSWDQISKKATDWWEGIKQKLQSLCTFYASYSINRTYSQAELDAVDDWTIDTTAGATTPVKVGSNASGLYRVPYDGYLTRLHKDEAVLNRLDAREWRTANAHGGLTADNSRLEALMGNMIGLMQQVVANTGTGQNIVLDSGALVGQLAPRMDMQLGTLANRKGRA